MSNTITRTGKVVATDNAGNEFVLGDKLDVTYTLEGEDAIVTAVPCGQDEVIIPLTKSNTAMVLEQYLGLLYKFPTIWESING